jgi:Arc/MetJ-type ribon-helix-helix transcriptional regulator
MPASQFTAAVKSTADQPNGARLYLDLIEDIEQALVALKQLTQTLCKEGCRAAAWQSARVMWLFERVNDDIVEGNHDSASDYVRELISALVGRSGAGRSSATASEAATALDCAKAAIAEDPHDAALTKVRSISKRPERSRHPPPPAGESPIPAISPASIRAVQSCLGHRIAIHHLRFARNCK